MQVTGLLGNILVIIMLVIIMTLLMRMVMFKISTWAKGQSRLAELANHEDPKKLHNVHAVESFAAVG